MAKFKVAAAQMAPVWLDREASTAKVCEWIVEAGLRQGADLIVLPESIIPGYPHWVWIRSEDAQLYRRFFKNSVEIPSETTERLCHAARQANTHVVVGVTERDDKALYNTLVFIDRRGKLLGSRRKLLPTHAEKVVWGMGGGDGLRVFDTDLGKIGGLICGEHMMELPRYALLAQGEQIHCATWVGGSGRGRRAFNSWTECAVRHHALAGRVFVINSQSCASDQEMNEMEGFFERRGGWTAIIGPNGAILQGPLIDQEGILYADLDLDDVLTTQAHFGAAGLYTRPDVLSLVLNRAPYLPMREAAGTGAGAAELREEVERLRREVERLQAEAAGARQ